MANFLRFAVMAGGRKPEAERRYRGEVAAFLQQVMASAGYESQADLARDLRVASSSISHWLNPESKRGVSAYNVLQVIRAAEGRKEGSTGLPATAAPSAGQGGIEEAAAAIAKEMEKGFAKLDRRLQRLEKRLPAAGTQSPARAARAASSEG